MILAQARSIELVDEAIRQITRVLRKRHRIENDRSDFRILSQSQILDNINETSMLITTIAAGIVGIAHTGRRNRHNEYHAGFCSGKGV